MASAEQRLCDSCNRVNNLVLRAPEKSDEASGPDQAASFLKHFVLKESKEAKEGAYFGPSLGTVLVQRHFCPLCQVVYRILRGRPEYPGSLERRVALRLVTKSGYRSDARKPWTYSDDQLEKYESGNNFRVEQHYGVAGLGIDLETAPSSGAILEKASIGLRVYKPADLHNPETDSNTTNSALEQLNKACPRTEVEAGISAKTVELAKEWLSECVNTHSTSASPHDQCDQTVSGYRLDDNTDGSHLPTRLIAVNPEGAPRLVETNGIVGRYLALSYRWGTVTEDTWRLRKANVQESLQQLPYALLPSTIRDAIEFTRRLNFEFVWIDSCCIVQDDNEDWAREAATMQTVYQNATMTIAVLGDRDSHSGFFERGPGAPAIEIPWLSDDGKKVAHVFVSDDLQFRRPEGRNECLTGLEQELSQSPWSTRAWTFQEQMLSRRTLYVGQQQLYFECRNQRLSEDGFDRIIKAESPRQAFMLKLRTDFTTAISSYMKDPKSWGTPSWIAKIVTKGHDPMMELQRKHLKVDIAQTKLNVDSLLHNYTSRNLTYPSDRLIAFEGLARAIATRSGQEFNAGLWTNKIAKSLFWWLADGPEARPASLRAPTWSWASWDGSVKGYDTELDTNDDMRVERKHVDFGAFDGAFKEVEILQNNPLVADHPGAKHVSLRLKALCFKLACSTEPALQFPSTWKQLREDVRLWSSANSSWDLRYCRLLFAPVDGDIAPKGWLRRKARRPRRRCPQCPHLLDNVDERRAFSHLERCLGHEPTDDRPCNDCPGILMGAAYFDEPREVPPSFELVLLWRTRSVNTVVRHSTSGPGMYEKGAQGLTAVGGNRGQYGWTELKRSDAAVLGFEGHDVRMSMDDVGSGPAFMATSNPKIYFCLLVEPTQVEGSYRRCGVALTYSIKGVKGAGLPLHHNCTEKELTLV